jgi:hypothetical protein
MTNELNQCDSGIEARLKGMSPDIAPIILRLISKASFTGELESSIRQIEDVFEKRLKNVKRDIHLSWCIATFCVVLALSLMNLLL